MKHFLTVLVFTIISYSECAKILGIFPFPGYSHFTVGHVLLKALAERGHEVTMISPFPQKEPIENYRDIDISSITTPINKVFNSQKASSLEMSLINYIPFIYELGEITLDETLKHEEIKKLLKSKKEKFDIVIISQCITDGMAYFAHHFNAPLISLSSVGANVYTNYLFANPALPSYVPHIVSTVGPKMSFFERFTNTYYIIYDNVIQNLIALPAQDKILHKHIPKAPSLKELSAATSIILLNSHPTVNDAVPLVSNMIEIGGFHVKPTGKLPKDIQDFLDDAPDGVIYFCLGSHVQLSKFSQNKIEAVVKTFGNVKQKVLWKFENQNVANLTKNVKIVNWAPQQDILAHRNVKLFISHGGILSSIESVYFGVPLIGIPINADQHININCAVDKGRGVKISIEDITEDILTNAINEVLNNEKYTKTSKELSRVMRDRIVSPMDQAIYWVEFVMDHPNTKYFKSAAMELNWYQYYLLDVILVSTLILYILLKVIFVIFTKLKRKNNSLPTKFKYN